MSYRAVVFFNLTGVVDDYIRVTSESYPTNAQAFGCLGALLVLGQHAKGHVEVEVPGIGWVREEDAETAVIGYRLRVSDRQAEPDYGVFDMGGD